MATLIVAVIGYFVLILALGEWARRRVRTTDDFILAGRRVPWWLIAGGVIATWVNSVTLMGYASMGASIGLAGYWNGGSFMLMTVLMGLWVVPRLRAAGVLTIPDFFARYFPTRRHRLLAVLLSWGRDIGVVASVAVSMAMGLATLFGLPLDVALLIVLVVTIVYTSRGGMWAVMVTDAVQALIFVVATVTMVVLGFRAFGGVAGTRAVVAPELLDPLAVGATQSLGWFLTGSLIAAGYQGILQRGLAAESTDAARKGFLWGGSFCLFWYMVPFVIGILGVGLLGPDTDPNGIFLAFASALLHPWVMALLSVAFIASAMSSLDSAVLSVSSNVAHDLYRKLWRPSASDREVLRVQRLAVVLVAVVGVLIGRALPMILELAWLGGRMMAAALAPCLLALVLIPGFRRRPHTIFGAMAAGAVATAIAQVWGARVADQAGSAFIWVLDPILLGLPVTLAVLVVGGLIERRIPPGVEDRPSDQPAVPAATTTAGSRRR